MAQGIKFHSGTPYTAHDTQFTFERASAAAAYHQGGETSDHPNGWATARMTFGTVNFANYSVADDYTFVVETPAPDASLAGSIMRLPHLSKEYVEANGDEHVDAVSAVGTGPSAWASTFPMLASSTSGTTSTTRAATASPANTSPGTRTSHSDPPRAAGADRRHRSG